MLRLVLLASLSNRSRTSRATRRLTLCTWLLGGFGAAELAQGHLNEPSGDWKARISGLIEEGPAPLPEGDADGDGLEDAWEDEVARRFAPVVVLDREDWNRPSSVPWLLARADVLGRERLQASFAGFAPSQGARQGAAPFSLAARRGSDDPSDWTTYVHVFPRAGGGVSVQYWFFYPYNDGPLLFDHEGDWEHATVRLDERGEPVGVYLARHEDNDPGPFRPWASTRRAGDHPVLLSARGSHATYADDVDLPWFEAAGACGDLEGCAHPVWRTWEGGGLENLGERARPRSLPEAMRYDGPWGEPRRVPGTSAPVGPLYHRGFCSGGFRGCRAAVQHGG